MLSEHKSETLDLGRNALRTANKMTAMRWKRLGLRAEGSVRKLQVSLWQAQSTRNFNKDFRLSRDTS